MTAGDVAAITEQLVRTEAAHGAYETAELNGVYDQDWARWYATYAVEHGIGGLLGREVTADELQQFLVNSYVDYQQASPKPAEPWADYTARRIAAEM
jgi:hypothetical protein